ncbi:phage tail tape measure protein [Paraclostridium sordellii]|uniref:phage tail tape measure protein n=1 Tax=Paraclostridium sordellii TaxID=1505 RepID=UPI0005E4DEAC|nr:phage tail tape measure protein [Paeniclostridium sordellii]CEP39722.1 phage tail tape measure protein [[Clostridium] sordellii] [Paeniclostridium sordellii]
MSEVISSLLVELGLDSKDFESSLKDVNRATKQMETAFNSSKKTLALSEKSIEDYNKTIQAGENVLKQYENKLDALNSAYTEQQAKLKSYKKEFDELPAKITDAEQNLKELERTIGTSSKEYQKAEKELQKYQQKLDGMGRTLSNAVSGLRSFENQIVQTENKMTQASKEVDDLREELSSLNDIDTSNLSSMFEGIDISNFTGQIDGLDSGLDLLSLGAKGAGLALAGMITGVVINGAKEYDQVITDLEINLGKTEQQAENIHNKIMSFADGGYNIENVAQGVEMLTQTMSLTDEEMKKVTQGMSIMNDRGYETSDMVRFMQMAYNNWGMSAEDALGMIIRGHQDGMNIAGDMMDTFLEYTPIFSQFGIDGEQAFALISEAMQDTGMDSDKVADMMKEVFLTITDGSTASKDALANVGIDVDSLKSKIDSGEITMVDAFNKVNKAILGVGDETQRAQALQDIYKGTVEYGNQSVLESWLSVKDTTLDTAGAIDEVTTAYENSYQASQQDFSNSWEQLKQTIGSGVLPVLTAVIDTFQNIIDTCTIVATNFGLQIQTTMNQFKAFFLELGIGILETLAKLPFAEKIMPNLNSTLESMKTNHAETIDYIQAKEQEMKNNADRINGEYKSGKEQTFNDVKNTADQKTKEMSNVVDTNTKDAGSKAKANMDTMKADVENSLSGLGNIALTETGEIPKATKANLDESARVIKQFSTDAYLGCKQSFSKLEQTAKTSMTNLYKGVTTSMSKTKTNVIQDATTMYNQSKKSLSALERSAKSSFSSLYNGCSNSMEKLKNSVISDWNTIRNTLSKGITGKVTMTRTNVTQNITKKVTTGARATKDTQQPNMPTTSSFASMNNTMASLRNNIQGIDFYGARYKSAQVVSAGGISTASSRINDKMYEELKAQNELLTQMLNALMNERIVNINSTLQVDGRQIAKASGRYIEQELNTMKSRSSRLAGGVGF